LIPKDNGATMHSYTWSYKKPYKTSSRNFLAISCSVSALLLLSSLPPGAQAQSPDGSKPMTLEQSMQTEGAKFSQPFEQSLNQPAAATPAAQNPAVTGGINTSVMQQAPQMQAAPVNPQNQVLVTPSSLIDLTSASFGHFEVNLDKAQFKETSLDHAHIGVQGMDFRQGTLKGLSISVSGGRFEQFIFDQMNIDTDGQMHFDPALLLTEKVLQFDAPQRANISVIVSQASLNQFLSSPKTLDKISVTASKRISTIASFFGANAANIGLHLTDVKVLLQKANKVVLLVTANVGMGGVGVPLSFQIDAKLGIKNGWVEITDAHLITNGQEISPQLSEALLKKVNSLASWGHRSDDIQFEFNDIKVAPGKQFVVKGTVIIKRLRLTRTREELAQDAQQNAQQSAIPPVNAPANPGSVQNPAGN
jgi:hypothetical protein